MHGVKRVYLQTSTIGITLAIFLTGCVTTSTSSLKETIELTPANPEAGRLRRVAVLPFAGPAGEQVSLELEGMLAQATIDGHPYFTISDRHTLQNAMNELKLRSSGLTDEQSAIRLGKFLGADGIYTGTIIVPPVTRQTHTEDRYSCPSNGKKLFSACQSPTKTTVTCTQKTVSYTVIPRLIEVSTARVIYAATKTASRTESFCSDYGAETPDALLLGNASTEALQQIRDDIAPHSYTVQLKLKESVDGLSEPARQRFGDALAFAKANRFDRACEIWQEIASANPPTLAVSYDLALCAETRGHLEDAQQQYLAIDKTLSRPDPDINEALNRLKDKLSERQAAGSGAGKPAGEPSAILPSGTKIPGGAK